MFRDILETIVDQTGGAVGAVLMGYDGIAIEQCFRPVEGVDLQLVAVEYANILKEIRSTAEILNTGEMEEVAIRTGRFTVVIRALNAEYFVALTLDRRGNFGQGRYLLLRESARLNQALS